MNNSESKKGLLAWFVANHVAANLLMLLIVIAGLLAIKTAKIEVFPETEVGVITVTVGYRGASPADVELGVCQRVEEAVVAVEGVKRLYSTAVENYGVTFAEIQEYADISEVLDDIKAQVDTITTFPKETEKPIIAQIKTSHRVITIMIYGDLDERTLEKISDQMRDDLNSKPNISKITVTGVRAYEISIEVSETNLRRYNLSFDDIVRAIKQSSLDIPAGSVKTLGGEILLRTKGQKYYGHEFENIVVLTKNDGTKLKLSDVATVNDAFEDTDLFTTFDGKRAAAIKVSRIGEQGALDVAETVKKYVAEKRQNLPEGVFLSLWQDDSMILKSRINLLVRNGYMGLVLVFVCLSIFLDFRLAFWVTMGIPISFLGGFWIMPQFDVSINMISLFALIMALGLVVDDAIVVGENIFEHIQRGLKPYEAAVKGVKEMTIPVVLSVLTTVFAFIPLAYTTGMMGKILRIMPIVMVSVLAVSLIEALLILPAHLSIKTKKTKHKIFDYWEAFRKKINDKMMFFVNGKFANLVNKAVKFRYVTLSMGIGILIVSIGLIRGGYVKFVFFDSVEADNMIAHLVMPQGTPVEKTQKIVDHIEKAALDIVAQTDAESGADESVMKHISVTVGAHPTPLDHGPGNVDRTSSASSHLAEVNVELLSGEKRSSKMSSVAMKNRWRDLVGEIPGISSLIFYSEIFSAGNDISIELSHKDFDVLLKASKQLKTMLRDFAGVGGIHDDFEEGKAEINVALTDDGRNLGLTLSDLARQVRQGFYGEEAQRVQRARNDIRVMVRYPKNQRKSIADIENMRIRLADGTEIPFKTVADVTYGKGYASIKRVDRKRVVTVMADVDNKTANADEINNKLKQTALVTLLEDYPGLQYRYAGAQRERNESMGSLKANFGIALFAIYALLAIQFRSYSQPIIVMSAIPFGVVGATLGHFVMGYNLSILSLFGIVALSGVVVNDSLIIIDLINRQRKKGIALPTVIRNSAVRRFRPIMLTTLTTFLGLMPILLERSLQARFLVPMAISIGFGVMFATVITLFIVPSLYMILEDVKTKLGFNIH